MLGQSGFGVTYEARSPPVRDRENPTVRSTEVGGSAVGHKEVALMPTVMLSSELVTLNPFGPARFTDIVHDGRNHILLRAALGTQEVVIKAPRPGVLPDDLAQSTYQFGKRPLVAPGTRATSLMQDPTNRGSRPKSGLHC